MPSFKLKILNRYVFRELFGPFLISLLIFSMVMLMGRTLRFSDLFINKGLALLDVGRLITYIFIPFLVYIIPMSVLLSVLLALGRLSADNEITSLKSSGISLYQLIVPVGAFSFLAFCLTGTIIVYAYPWGFASLREFAYKIAKTSSEIGMQERVFNDSFEGMIIYVDKISVRSGNMQGIFISDRRDPAISTTILAKEAFIGSDPAALSVNMRLYNGSFHRVSSDLDTFQMGNFDTYDIVLDLKSSFGELKKRKRKYREMTLSELLREKGTSSREKQELNEINIEYHKKFSIPCAAFVFGLIGIPLGIRKIRGGKSYGFTISLIVIMLYYLLLLTAETLAKNNTVMPLIAMWLPNVVLGTLGLLLLRSAARESVPAPVRLLGLFLSRWRAQMARLFHTR
jgi:lipopolysaccharide export system permease protein